jgi:hypothetical protein
MKVKKERKNAERRKNEGREKNTNTNNTNLLLHPSFIDKPSLRSSIVNGNEPIISTLSN